MPILDVQIVGPLAPPLEAGVAARLAAAAAGVFASPPGATWVRLHRLAAEDYAENGGIDPGESPPVFVALLLADPPEGAARASQAAALAAALAGVVGRPSERVHILYEPAGRGRVAFGGVLRS